MTEQEKNIIKNEIMDALLYGSKTIDQLTLSSDINDADLFEISGGRAITYSTLKAAIAASIANGGGSGSGHTHANKESLDQIATDSDGYIHLTYPKRVLNEATKEYETIITTEKVKAGYADKAEDLTENSPVLKLINTIGNQFVPTYLEGSTYVDTTWAEIVAGTRTLAAIKSVKGFFSDSFISARGANSAGGGSTGGAYYLSDLLDTAIDSPASGQTLVYNGSKWVNGSAGLNESQLASYLSTNNYAKKSDLPDLTLYLTKTAAAAIYVTQEEGKGLTANDFTDALKAKLDGIEAGANKYILPAASASTLGGVKVGSTLAMTNGVLDQKAGIVSGGVYPKVTVDTYGRVTAGELLAASDIPNLPWSKITSGTPTTIAGYGITDTYTKTDADNRFVQQSLFDSMFAKESDGNGGFRIKAKYGLYSDSFISARGANPDGGGSGGGGVYYLHELLDAAINNPASGQALIYNGTKWVNQAIQTGLDETALAAYLTTHSYATQSWVESKGYLTAHQSLANYVTLNTPQNITANKVFYGEERFVANGLTYTDPWSGIACAIKVTGKVGITDSIKAASFIKSDGTSSQFLKADGSVDGNAYLTTVSAAATYVSKAGDTMTGALRMGQSVASAPASQPMALSYGRLQCYGTLNINGNTDNSGTEYVNITAGHGLSASTADGLSIGTNTLTWQNQTVWHAGNDGAGSGLDADLLDGYHKESFDGYRYTKIDASTLDNNTWYPVVFRVPRAVQTRIRIEGGSAANASWNSRSDKQMAVFLDYTVQGSDWGWVGPQRVINFFTLGAGASGSNCIAGLGQLTNNSWEYVMVRGGAVYNFYLSHWLVPELKTSTFTNNGQSIAPTTTSPTAITRNNAWISDNVASATKLQSARTLWGQSFDGTANVSGSLTGVSSIGFNGNYELGIHNGRYVFGTTGQVGAVGANVGSLLISNMWADATKVPTNGIYVKGSLRIGDITLSYDAANGGLHVTGGGLYADTYLSARGANTSGSGSSGGGLIQQVYGSSSLGGAFSDTTLTDTFNAYTINKIRTDLINADSALSSRITSLEGGAAVNVTTTGSGNAITAISKSGTTITATKGATFLTAHQSLANYVTLNTTQTITGAKTFSTDVTFQQPVNTYGFRLRFLENSNFQGGFIGYDGANNIFRIGVHEVNDTNLSNDLNAISILRSNAYVGIGTTSPTQKLHVNGNALASQFIKSGGTASQFLMGDGSVVTKKSLSTVDNSGWTTFATDDKLVPTMAFIAYWNGRHNASNSNLQYCDRGRFGTIVTHSHSEYVTALGTSGDYLTWTKNGATNNITVPYATTAAQLTGSAEHTGTALTDFDNAHTYTCQATNDLGDGISYSAILTVSGGSQHRFFQIIGGKGNPSYLRWRTTDANGTALGAVHRLLDDANYSSVLDSRYYTESEADARFVNVTGDTMTGLLTAKVGATHTGIKLGNTYLTAINGDTILQNNNAIRFGTDAWDYNQWAGLKYSHTDKTVYLGLADGSIFTANAAQSGGKILTPGISNIYVGNNTTNKVWHAGNDGSGSGLDADKLDGYHNGALTAQYLNRADFVTSLNAVPPFNGIFSWGGTNSANPAPYGVMLQWSSADNPTPGTDQHWITQLASATSNRLFYRTRINTGAWSGWSAVAFTSDNVASATKLQTARSLWGQSFNGTGNVDGALTVHHTGACGVYISGGGESSYSCQASGGLRWVSGGYPDRYFIWDSSNNERLSILNNGNVGIGTTSPSYKLDVSGVIHSTTGIWSNGYVSARGQNTASDARLKIILQTKLLDTRSIAAAPSVLFSWKDDGREDVGSIAQYWQRIDRHLVSHRPDGYLGLDYGKAALLSVISVAKQTLNHEERIKALEKENKLLKEQIKSLT